MNMYRKLNNGDWAISSDDATVKAGDTVTVTLKSGATKTETLGAMIYAVGPNAIFAIAKRATPSVAVGDLSGILAVFRRAQTHLNHPAITLQTRTGEVIRVNIAGERARVPGSLTVVSQDRDPTTNERHWYGRVHTDGRYEPATSAPSSIGDLLRAFAADPVRVATEHGRLTGKCCFCNTKLTDERSTAVGYGKTCADHFGLAWGARPATFAAAA